MIHAETPITIHPDGTTVPAADLGSVPSVYDPVSGRFDMLTDILVRNVTLVGQTGAAFMPHRLPDRLPDPVREDTGPGGPGITIVSPRQPLALGPEPEGDLTETLTLCTPTRLGTPCLNLLGTTVTYVAVFFDRRRFVLSNGYLLRAYILDDVVNGQSRTPVPPATMRFA